MALQVRMCMEVWRLHVIATAVGHARPDLSCLFKPVFTLSARISFPLPARSFVFVLQEAMTAFEACPVPVIAAVHGHCVGAGGGLGLLGGCRWGSGAAWLPFQQRHLSAGSFLHSVCMVVCIAGCSAVHCCSCRQPTSFHKSAHGVSHCMLSARAPACRSTGIDMITACDIRLATENAVFCVKASPTCNAAACHVVLPASIHVRQHGQNMQLYFYPEHACCPS